MVLYTLEQRWVILRHYFENHGNVVECERNLHTDFGGREAASAPYVRYLVKKAKETCILIDKRKREKLITVCKHENIAAVGRHHLTTTLLKRILLRGFGLTPYKAQLI